MYFQMESQQLQNMLDRVCELLLLPYFASKNSQWLKSTLDNLAKIMKSYGDFLQSQNQRSKKNNQNDEPVRSYKDNWSLTTSEACQGQGHAAYDELKNDLSSTDIYKPLCLQDYAPKDRYDRRDWLQNLQLPFPVSVYTYCSGNYYGNTTYAWRLPEDLNDRSDESQMNAISQVRETIPIYSTRAMRMDFINKFSKVTKTKPAILRAMWSYLQGTKSAPENEIESTVDERVTKFLLESYDVDLIYDLRSKNGRPKDATLDLFWEELDKYLAEITAVHERRHRDTLYMPFAISAKDLIEQIKKRLPDGTPVPSISWLKLNFQPSNPYHRAAMNYTERFKVRYSVQQRLLRAQHDDASYCSYQFTMLKQMASMLEAEMICVDDKAVVPIGEPDKPISTGVHAHNKSLTLSGMQLGALDHDFHIFGIVPSVLFHVDVPGDYRDGFYTGTVHVTLKDKVLQASSPMRHTTENVSILRDIASSDGVNLDNPVLFIYSDGGPDHRTNYHSVQTSLVTLFVALDLDLLVAARTAPCQSYQNPAERIMSTLNLGLQNVSLSRQRMSDVNEVKIRSKTNLKKVRTACDKDARLKEEVVHSVQEPISIVRERFSRLIYKEESVRIHAAATEAEVKEMEKSLAAVLESVKDPDCDAYQQEFMDNHCRKRHYTFQVSLHVCLVNVINYQKFIILPGSKIIMILHFLK